MAHKDEYRNIVGYFVVVVLAFLLPNAALANAVPTYTATTGTASFTFPNEVGSGQGSFSVTGLGVSASGGNSDPSFGPRVAPPGATVLVFLPFIIGQGDFGSAVAGGTSYPDLLFTGFANVSASLTVMTGTETVPASWVGSLVACSPSQACANGGPGATNVFNLDFAPEPGLLTITFVPDGHGMDFVESASFRTPTPEPPSVLLTAVAGLLSMACALYRRQHLIGKL
jgi:hypothetical protein